jgi:hypothetical protein
MASDHEFVRQRLNIVERYENAPDAEYEYVGRGRGRRLNKYEQPAQIPLYEYEARLLKKLLMQTHEGQVNDALSSWRRQLKKFLAAHEAQHQVLRNSWMMWLALPPDMQDSTPQPPPVPPAIFVDQQGVEWHVNASLLTLLDDLIARLHQWLETA